MSRLLFLLLGMLLIFGCIDLGGQPANETGKNISVTINVEPQKNVTVIINETKPPENQTTAPEEWKGPTYRYDPSANLGVYFIDACDYEAGQHATAILVKKEDLDMLIDAGSQHSGAVVDFLKTRGVDDIDVLVSTAEDSGRYGGLKKVADEFGVEEFWWSGQATTSAYREAVDYVMAKAKNSSIVSYGYKRELNGIKTEVLNPPVLTKDVYNDAVVLRVEDRGKIFLFLSDTLGGAQSYMANNQKEKIKCNVMEAPYYGLGSGTAVIGVFLQTAKPGTVVINGCSDETAEKEGSTRLPFKRLMGQYGISYLETYKNGTVKATVKELNNISMLDIQ